jgi:type IV pilus assembly protein PilB
MSEQPGRKKFGEELVRRDVITREELAEVRARERESGVPWYRQLLQKGSISFSAFDDILKHEWHSKSARKEHESLGDTLLRMKAVSKEDLQAALTKQRRTGRLLGNVLLDMGVVDGRTINIALSKQHGLEFSEADDMPSEPEALHAVPRAVARKNNMIPIRVEGDRLTVLIADPQMSSVMRDVGVLLGVRIHPILTSVDDVRSEIQARYDQAEPKGKRAAKPKKKAAPAKPKVETKAKPKPKTKKETTDVATTKETTKASGDKYNFDEIARQASGVSVMKLVTTIIEGAANSGATDVHLDPQEPEMRVRYRIDGVLHDVMSLAADIEGAVISRIKIMSDLDITETRRPQDGHIGLEVGDQEYDVRVATLPTFLGERIVLRLLDQSSVLQGIKDLGLESDDEKMVGKLISQAYGMVLVTGPTGSGKTTSLYAALNQKNVVTESIVTLEDPVEYQLSGINQVQIDTDIDVTFAQTLRAAMRQDIDVLLVGEIRDPETARIAVRAAMTGHLVFSTLHTNDAPEAISTLRNMDVPSYLIASALTGIVAQRLVRKICPECKTGFTPTKALLKSLKLPESTRKLYRGAGCEHCYHTGTRGRTGVFEVIEITPAIREMIAAEAPIEKITKAAKLKTMADRCRLKVKQGIIPPEEFLRVVRT